MPHKIVDGRTDLVFEYIAEANAATSTDSGGTALNRWCAYHGDVSAVRYLLEHGESLQSLGENLDLNGADPNTTTKPNADTGSFMRDCRTKAETPLHRAAAFGTERTIQQLLGAEARREAKDVNGETPLAWASWYLRPASILKLLCYGKYSIRPDNRSSYDHGLGWAQPSSRPHDLSENRTTA